MIELSKDKIIERFRSYVALDTASDDKSETSPSTAKQLKLAKLLKSELSRFGFGGRSTYRIWLRTGCIAG